MHNPTPLSTQGPDVDAAVERLTGDAVEMDTRNAEELRYFGGPQDWSVRYFGDVSRDITKLLTELARLRGASAQNNDDANLMAKGWNEASERARTAEADRARLSQALEGAREALEPFAVKTVDFQGQVRFVGYAPSRSDYARARKVAQALRQAALVGKGAGDE